MPDVDAEDISVPNIEGVVEPQAVEVEVIAEREIRYSFVERRQPQDSRLIRYAASIFDHHFYRTLLLYNFRSRLV